MTMLKMIALAGAFALGTTVAMAQSAGQGNVGGTNTAAGPGSGETGSADAKTNPKANANAGAMKAGTQASGQASSNKKNAVGDTTGSGQVQDGAIKSQQ